MNFKKHVNMKNLLFENKNTKQTIVKNVFWLGFTELIQKGVAFLVIVWLARYFGPPVYGKWAFALNFTILFSVLADFGFSYLSVREIARDKSKTSYYIDNIIMMKLILGFVALALMIVTIWLLEKDHELIKLVLFLGIYSVLNTFVRFFKSVFRANEKMQYEAASQMLQSLCLLGLVLFLILNKGSALMVSYAYIVAVLIGIVFSLAIIWRNFSKFFLKIDLKKCKQILKKSWPFALSSVATFTYFRIDTVMLGFLKENEIVGYYNAAYNVVFIMIAGISLFVSAIFPLLSNLYKNCINKFESSINIFFKLIFFLSFPVIIFFFFFSKPIISMLYGKEFVEYSPLIFKILVWSVFVLYNYAVFAIGLSASDKQKFYLKGVMLGAIFNVLTNLIVIPKYSCYGAAVTTVLTEIVVCSYMVYKFLDSNKIKLPIGFIMKVTFASLGMFVMIFGLLQLKINLIIAMTIGLLVYIVFIVVLKVFKKNLFSLIKSVDLIK